MESKNDAKEIVMSYIRALDSQEYDSVGAYLNSSIRIRGPAAESFSSKCSARAPPNNLPG